MSGFADGYGVLIDFRREALSMSRPRLLLGVVVVALLGVVGFVIILWLTTPAPAPVPGVTWEDFRRLREGTSVMDAEALLGIPWHVLKYPDHTVTRWRGEEVVIELDFHADRLTFGRGRSCPPPEYSDHFEYIRTEDKPYRPHSPTAPLVWPTGRVSHVRSRLLHDVGAVALLGVAGLALFLWLTKTANTGEIGP